MYGDLQLWSIFLPKKYFKNLSSVNWGPSGGVGDFSEILYSFTSKD